MQHLWHTARNELIAIGGKGRLITSLYLQYFSLNCWTMCPVSWFYTFSFRIAWLTEFETSLSWSEGSHMIFQEFAKATSSSSCTSSKSLSLQCVCVVYIYIYHFCQQNDMAITRFLSQGVGMSRNSTTYLKAMNFLTQQEFDRAIVQSRDHLSTAWRKPGAIAGVCNLLKCFFQSKNLSDWHDFNGHATETEIENWRYLP